MTTFEREGENPAISLRTLRASSRQLPWPEDGCFTVRFHPEIEEVVRALPNFTPVEKYAADHTRADEIGALEIYKFLRDSAVQGRAWVIE